ncbi:MAG: Ig-like domain-containing protein, partial [Rhodoferax sp.]|nr:Ig-like domain-containing protein [Rhodoferax sp.]
SVSTFSKTYAYNDSLAGTAPWQAATLAESDIGTGATQLRPGTVSVKLVTVDAAGNESPASAATTFTLDTFTYATPVLTLATASSDGSLSKAEATNSPVVFTMPTDSGTLFTYIFTDSYGNSKTGAGSSYLLTTQEVTLASSDIGNAMGQLHDGLITVTAVVSSLAGSGIGTSAPGSTSFVLDTTAPMLAAATIAADKGSISLTFSEAIDSSALTLAAANNLLVLKTNTSGGTTITSPYTGTPGFNGNTVTLTLTSAATTSLTTALNASQTPSIEYTDAAGDQASAVVQDTGGNDMATLATPFSLSAVPVATGFTVSDSVSSNGLNRGKAGELVSVLVNFSETVSISPNTTYTARVQIGTSNANVFDATLVTPATAPTAASSYTFTGTLPNTAGLTSDALTITSLSNTGGINNSINNSTGRALGTANLPLASKAYLVDSTAPTTSLTLAEGQSWSNTLPAGHSATIQFTFTENPGSSFTLQDITTTGGTLSNLTGYAHLRYATFTPTPNANNGSATIRVAAGSYADAAGNANVDAPTLSFSFDTLPPTPPITNLGSGVTDGATAAEATQASG